MSLEDTLRPHRKALVEAAERVMSNAFKDLPDLLGDKEKGKSQLNHLVSVCNEAACKEEIENYLRYQATRQNVAFWGKGRDRNAGGDTLAQRTIHEINRIDGLMTNLNDAARVAAWKLYAVFLTRAYTYQKAGGGRTFDRAQGGRP